MTEDTQEYRAPQNRNKPHYSIPSLQAITSWNVTDIPSCSDHRMITVNIQSKISEPQTKITKFNINKANSHLFTSNEAWKEVTNPNRTQSAESRTKIFSIKKSKYRKICYIIYLFIYLFTW